MTITLHPPAGTTAAGVDEKPPAGWIVLNIKNGGTLDPSTGLVKWGPLFNPADPTVLTYDVTPPGFATGDECYQGFVSFGGPEDIPIEGDNACVIIPAVSPWALAIAALLTLGAGGLIVPRKKASTP